MILSLKIFLLCCIFLFLSVIVMLLRNKKISLKYSLLWLFSAISMILITIFPQIIFFASQIIGIKEPVNLVFVFAGMFSILIILSLTVIVSKLNSKITQLAQNIALIEKRLIDIEIINDK
jgi:hypothetical protein